MSVNISSRVFVDSSDNQNVDNPLLKSIQVNGNKQPTINDEYLIKLDVGQKYLLMLMGALIPNLVCLMRMATRLQQTALVVVPK